MNTQRRCFIGLTRLRVHFTDQLQRCGDIFDRCTGTTGQLLQIAIRQHVEMIQYHDHHIIQQAAFTRLNTQTFGKVTRKNSFRLQPLNSVQDSLYLCFRTAADSRDIG